MNRRVLVLAGLLILALPAAVAAQGGQQQQTPRPAGPDTTRLVFEREVFQYPDYERRNPFAPLLGSLEGGPQFDQVRLLGIIYSSDPSRSVVLLGSGDTSRRLRVGESWGNTRVLEIQPEQVIVEVEEFGLTEQRVLELSRRRGGGGPEGGEQ